MQRRSFLQTIAAAFGVAVVAPEVAVARAVRTPVVPVAPSPTPSIPPGPLTFPFPDKITIQWFGDRMQMKDIEGWDVRAVVAAPMKVEVIDVTCHSATTPFRQFLHGIVDPSLDLSLQLTTKGNVRDLLFCDLDLYCSNCMCWKPGEFREFYVKRYELRQPV